MYSAGRQDHRHGDAARGLLFIGENDVLAARAHCLFRLAADALKRFFQRSTFGCHIICCKGTVDDFRAEAKACDQALIHAGREHRALKDEHFLLGLVRIQNVAEVLEPRAQAHHAALAQGVDGRICDLAEILPEEVAHRTIGRGQDGRGRIVAHRADGFLSAFRHRRKDQLKCFQRKACGRLAAQQIFAVEEDGLRSGTDFRLELNHRLEPLFIRRLSGKVINDLAVIVELARLKVRRDHAARRDRSALGNLVIAERAHPCLGADRKDTVRRQSITQRAKTVAVEAGDSPTAIEGRDAGRAIPGLHHGVAIVVKGAVRSRHHRLALRPGLRDQHRLRHRRRAA